jgi:hypothetical protein
MAIVGFALVLLATAAFWATRGVSNFPKFREGARWSV